MIIKNENCLYLRRMGLPRLEIERLEKKYPSVFDKKNKIEELLVLLESLYIFDMRQFLEGFDYLFSYDFYSLAKEISLEINKQKDYHKALHALKERKFKADRS